MGPYTPTPGATARIHAFAPLNAGLTEAHSCPSKDRYMNPKTLYIGLMSGTSIDSIDAALVRFDGESPDLVAHHGHPIAGPLKQKILALCEPGANELDRMGELDRIMGLEFARAAQALLASSGHGADQIDAIGSHGQTVRHRPPGHAEHPFTVQIGDPNTIAEVTGIRTIADFRRRDMAAGGQGAPLAPAFHQAAFGDAMHERVILNVGGMANVTHLPKTGIATGFDTGPGNVLMDAWVHRHRGEAYDRDGQWASQGTPDPGLLEALLAHPFFARTPPKSTGREAFHLDWLNQIVGSQPRQIPPVDVQATLLELTARSVVECIETLCAGRPMEVFVCGGGAYNTHLMRRLGERLAPHSVRTTTGLGLLPEWVEAAAFAWLARRTQRGLFGNLPAVTGADHEVILGGVYPP